jgi:hypothetical protein
MTAPPVGVMCADCKAAPAAVQAGNEWVCWVCDEKASQAAESGAFEIALVSADGEDMRPEYRYDGAWAKLKAGVGREDVVMTFPSRVDAKRATFALAPRSAGYIRGSGEASAGGGVTAPIEADCATADIDADPLGFQRARDNRVRGG